MAQYASRDDIDELRLQMAQAIFGGLPDSEPIRHWTQGLAPLADAFGPRDRQDEERETVEAERVWRSAMPVINPPPPPALMPNVEPPRGPDGWLVPPSPPGPAGELPGPPGRIAGWTAQGFGSEPPGFSLENPPKYPLTYPAWQPFAPAPSAALFDPAAEDGVAAPAADPRSAAPDQIGYGDWPLGVPVSEISRMSEADAAAHVDDRLAAYHAAPDRAAKDQALDRALDAAYAWRVQGGSAALFQRIADAVAGDYQDALTARVVRDRADAIAATGISSNIRALNNNGVNFGAQMHALQRAIARDPDNASGLISRAFSTLRNSPDSAVTWIGTGAFRQGMSGLGYGRELQDATAAYNARQEGDRIAERAAVARMSPGERASHVAGKVLDAGAIGLGPALAMAIAPGGRPLPGGARKGPEASTPDPVLNRARTKTDDAMNQVRERDPNWLPAPGPFRGPADTKRQIAIELDWHRQAEERLKQLDAGSPLTPSFVPLGFRTPEQFVTFGRTLQGGLETAGHGLVQPFLRGSSLTGRNFLEGHPFDSKKLSDLDLAVASPELLRKARRLGIPLDEGTRTKPLTGWQLKELGLSGLADTLERQAGRPVTFMIYQSADAVAQRTGPYLPIPGK